MISSDESRPFFCSTMVSLARQIPGSLYLILPCLLATLQAAMTQSMHFPFCLHNWCPKCSLQGLTCLHSLHFFGDLHGEAFLFPSRCLPSVDITLFLSCAEFVFDALLLATGGVTSLAEQILPKRSSALSAWGPHRHQQLSVPDNIYDPAIISGKRRYSTIPTRQGHSDPGVLPL